MPSQSGARYGYVETETDQAQARLAKILAEISSTPVSDFFPTARTQPRRDPSVALKVFVFLDAIALIASFFAAWGIAVLLNNFVFDRPTPELWNNVDMVTPLHFGLVATGIMLWFTHKGHYRRRMPFWLETQKVVNAFVFALLVHGFLQFAAKQDFSRLWLMSGWFFGAVSVLFIRNLARVIMRRKGKWQVRTLLVGGGAMADDARAALRSEPGLGYEIVMQVENLHLVLATLEGSWEKLCDRFNADYVVIALEGDELTKADQAIEDLAMSGIPFSVAPPLRNLPVLGMAAQYFFSHDVILMAPVDNLEQPLPRLIKRTMDVVVSGAALLALSPIFLLLCTIVKRDGGPAFFGDVRVGANGTAFHCLKFRSMVVNGDKVLAEYLAKNPERKQEWEVYHKLRDGDPRVTRIGDFMRRWSIDEIPQLINVLKGDMSLVGPRPIMFRERGEYSRGLAHYSRVRPGLTGLWQVSGRSNVSFMRRVQMDTWYVRNWSLWHDIAILCKTVPVILKKTGAC